MPPRDLVRRAAQREQPPSNQTREGFTQHRRGFVGHVKDLLRGLLIRIALLLAGCTWLFTAVWINLNAGHEILAGLLSPDSPAVIVVSVARLLAPALGLGLIYRGLR